jgi:hypothetical protein
VTVTLDAEDPCGVLDYTADVSGDTGQSVVTVVLTSNTDANFVPRGLSLGTGSVSDLETGNYSVTIYLDGEPLATTSEDVFNTCDEPTPTPTAEPTPVPQPTTTPNELPRTGTSPWIAFGALLVLGLGVTLSKIGLVLNRKED